MNKRRIVSTGVGGLVAVLGAFAVHGYIRAHAPLVDVLPTFVAPDPGPRAPTYQALGFRVGSVTLPQALSQLQSAGITCSDTSMRALMAQARAETRREMAARAARGDDPDGVSGASMVNHHSPKEANPQVRLSCEDVPGRQIGDRVRDDTRGRLLLIFDSPQHPLRHISFDRSLPSNADLVARRQLAEARAAFELHLGKPARSTELPSTALPLLSPVDSEWLYSDLRVRISALNYGPRGIVLSEIVEVPWPVRADAPTL